MSTLSRDLTASLSTSLSPSRSQSIPTVAADPPTPWRLGTRLAFRWCVAYFGVCYILLTGLGSLSLGLIHSPDSLPPLKNMIECSPDAASVTIRVKANAAQAMS